MRILKREVAMKNVRSHLSMALLCRQQAVFHPESSWKYLSDAERREHLAQTEISAFFDECNPTKTEVSALRPAVRSNAV
jgi:hypothetical protein